MNTISNKNKHLSLQERFIIENGIRNGSSKKAIADTLGKDKSTIGKEIKLHRSCSYKCKLPLECSAYKKCSHGRLCSSACPDFIPFVCARRDRSPGACNGCTNFHRCRFDKFVYSPDIAHKEYRSSLIDSRLGINTTIEDIKMVGKIIMPLLKQGQSVYQILASHPEIPYSEKTLYSYIEDNIFKDAGIDISVFDLRRKVSRKILKKKAATYKKREDRRFLKGRLYSDYKALISQHPDLNIVQMDTVYNDVKNGPFIQTFKFIKYGFLFALLHDRKDAQSMLDGIDILESIIGAELFNTEVQILLTDRGSEFTAADAMEIRGDETRRTSVYYCDPLQSCQKGSLENNHIELRYICPSGTDLRKLGLLDQSDLNTVISHVNSSPKEKLNGKSPIEYLEFLNPLLIKKFYDFGVTKIDKDKVILKPYLIKK